MSDPVLILSEAPIHQLPLPDGGVVTFAGLSGGDGVLMAVQDANGTVLTRQRLSYDEYDEVRQKHPDIALPDLRPAESGNTIGKVVGEQPASGQSAAEASPTVDDKNVLQKGKEATRNAIDAWVESTGYNQGAMVAGAIATAVAEVFLPESWWELIPVGKVVKIAKKGAEVFGILKKGEQATEAAAGFNRGQNAAGEAGSQGGKQSNEAAKATAGQKKPSGNDSQVKKANKLNCADRGPYKDQKKKSGDNQFDRDHVPSKAALIERARQLAKAKGFALTPEMKSAIIQRAATVAIPKLSHRRASPTFGQVGKSLIGPDAAAFKAAVQRDLTAMLAELRQTDSRCYRKYKRFASKLMKALLENKDVYDDFLLKIINPKN